MTNPKPRARRCAHCGAKATERWDLMPCAIGRKRRFDLCTPCDIELNEMVLRYVAAPDADELMAKYRAKQMPVTQPANITIVEADRAVANYLNAQPHVKARLCDSVLPERGANKGDNGRGFESILPQGEV